MPNIFLTFERMVKRSAKKLGVGSGKLKVITQDGTKTCRDGCERRGDRVEGGRGARMAGLEEDADGRGKGESCKAKRSKGLQGGFVFGKRTHGAKRAKEVHRHREDGVSEKQRTV